MGGKTEIITSWVLFSRRGFCVSVPIPKIHRREMRRLADVQTRLSRADLYFAIRNFFFKRSRDTEKCMCMCMCVNIGNFLYTQFEINAKLGRPGEEARQELRASRITHRFFVAISSRKTGT